MLIKSISYWSFVGGDGSKPVAQAFAEAKKYGYDAVEVCLSETGDVSMQTTEKSAKEIVKAAADNGIKIASVATSLFGARRLSSADQSVRAKGIELGEQLIDVASWLDAGAVLVVPGRIEEDGDPDGEWARATDGVSQLVPRAEAAKIAIGIENVWNKFITGPFEFCKFVDQFNSEYVKAYLDVGNLLGNGYPEQWIRVLGKRITRIHFKDFRRSIGNYHGFVDLLSGDVNWPEVGTALDEVGYNGPVTAEMGLYQHYPEVLLANTSRAMDAILGR